MRTPAPNPPGGVTTANRKEFPHQRFLLIMFLLSLPLVNPTVHGDGVGYYAYARTMLIQHDLRFEEDWRRANSYYSSSRLTSDGQLRADQYTPTGLLDNHFTVGPAMLWMPFLVVAHTGVLIWNAFGGHIPADGFSPPYLIAMAVGTAFYGFLGLLLSFSLARKYVRDRWAFLATVGIWLASSLPVYMYFNPSWSHAHSAFAVAWFLWYWERTRGARSAGQWCVLGLIAGLMIDVYLPNGVFLLIPVVEGLLALVARTEVPTRSARQVLLGEGGFALALWFALLPTLITRKLVYGGFFRVGAYSSYPWDWSAPHRWQVLFSSDHGAFTWTPVLILAVLGFFLSPKPARIVAMYLAAAAFAFYYVIASYPYWDGMSSFGNRFLISLTPIFIFGLALAFERWGNFFLGSGRAFVAAAGLVAVLAAWNAGFILQWGEHLIPVRGEISFRDVIHNQVFVVPHQLAGHLSGYLFRRKDEMREIEKRDIEQIRNDQTKSSPSP